MFLWVCRHVLHVPASQRVEDLLCGQGDSEGIPFEVPHTYPICPFVGPSGKVITQESHLLQHKANWHRMRLFLSF
jgi:hypothetical protein